MPTRGRREYALQALDSFQGQTYPRKELIILDDSEDPSFNVYDFSNMWWFSDCSHAISTSRIISEKRNACCRMANGEIIIHWDSDDWSAPDRIADQVERLEQSGKSVTGYSEIIFYDARAP